MHWIHCIEKCGFVCFLACVIQICSTEEGPARPSHHTPWRRGTLQNAFHRFLPPGGAWCIKGSRLPCFGPCLFIPYHLSSLPLRLLLDSLYPPLTSQPTTVTLLLLSLLDIHCTSSPFPSSQITPFCFLNHVQGTLTRYHSGHCRRQGRLQSWVLHAGSSQSTRHKSLTSSLSLHLLHSRPPTRQDRLCPRPVRNQQLCVQVWQVEPIIQVPKRLCQQHQGLLSLGTTRKGPDHW